MPSRGPKRRKTLRTREHRAIYRALKDLREKTGLSQVKVSRAIGLYDNYLCKVEKGDQVPDVVEFIWLAQALGVDPRKLLEVAL
jgi:transcriptional regulator with XRE-family HTH domain